MFQFIVAKLGVRFILVFSELKFFFLGTEDREHFSSWIVAPLATVLQVLGYRGEAGAQLSFALSSPSLPREKFIPHRPLQKKVSLLFQPPEIYLC